MKATDEHFFHQHLVSFTDNVCQTFEDMAGKLFVSNQHVHLGEPFSHSNGMAVYMHFAGAIQGDYILAMGENVACGLIDRPMDDCGSFDLKLAREESGEFLKEALNVAASKSIVELEGHFGSLTPVSPILVFGDIYFPDILSGSIEIIGELGKVRSVFCLNMVDSKLNKQLKAMEAALNRKSVEAVTDGLTGLYNRSFFDNYFTKCVNNANRYHKKLSIALIDIDHFKALNDSHGHAIGDRALKLVASSIQNVIRGSDIACRYGGDELVVIMTETDGKGALIVARRIQLMLKATWTSSVHSLGVKVKRLTLSIGVAALEGDEGAEQFFKRADEALYQSKFEGRNRIYCSVKNDQLVPG